MREWDDIALLREYVERDSGEAFAELVARHVNKVYSAALRLTRNPHSAEEITQAVFVILAKKAGGLGKGVILSGWLYQTARLTAVTYIRSEIRRAKREQEAYMQTSADETEPKAWRQIAPLLDAAMAGLSDTDRHAVVLRFFDGKSLKEVGSVLGGSEDAAKMRVSRAVEKLRRFFTKRGVVVPAAVLTAAIAANSVQAAPAVLVKSATAVGIAKGATASGTILAMTKGALNIMAWTKAKMVIVIGVSAVLALGVAEQLVVHYQSQVQAGNLPSETLRRLRSAGPDDYFPRSAWVFAGYDDPKSAVMTSLWAVRQGDGEKILECATPEARQKMELLLAQQAQAEGKSVNELMAQRSIANFSKNNGFRLLNVTTISNGVVAVHLVVPDDPHIEHAFLLKKVGNEWKVDDFRK